MKKHFGKNIVILGASLMCVGALAGCNSGPENSETTLNIVCLNRGYGRAWIDDLITEWEAANPGYKVHLDANYNADAVIQKHLYSKDNVDDLYIGCDSAWKQYAATGLFLNLDSFLEEKVDGVKVVDKINGEYNKSIYFGGHTYRLPWTSGIPGIYYNAKMFKDNRWEVPKTYNELVELCSTIKKAKIRYGNDVMSTQTVAPFAYTGENLDYFDYAVFTWWAQLSGKEAVDKHLLYESAETFSESNPTFNNLKKSLQMWWDIFGDTTNYVKGSESWTNFDAQTNFYNGAAAMMINCDWLYNEIITNTSDKKFRDGFELEIMNTPVAEGAKDEHISYIVGEDQYFAIPASTIKADLAKSFLKLMISDKGIKTFAEKAHGTLAYRSTTTVTASDNYTQSLINYSNNAERRFTNWSNSQLFLGDVLDIWSDTHKLPPYLNVINNKKANKADPVGTYMSLVSSTAASNWAKWQRDAGVK